MVHTRTRSVSDTSALPTQGLGLFFSRSNSARSSGAHADLLEVSACLSTIVRAMAFLQVSRLRSLQILAVDLKFLTELAATMIGASNPPHWFRPIYSNFYRAGNGIEAIAQGGQTARAGGRRLHERPAGGAAAAARRLGRRRVRAGGERACGPRRRHRRATGPDRDAA